MKYKVDRITIVLHAVFIKYIKSQAFTSWHWFQTGFVEPLASLEMFQDFYKSYLNCLKYCSLFVSAFWCTGVLLSACWKLWHWKTIVQNNQTVSPRLGRLPDSGSSYELGIWRNTPSTTSEKREAVSWGSPAIAVWRKCLWNSASWVRNTVRTIAQAESGEITPVMGGQPSPGSTLATYKKILISWEYCWQYAWWVEPRKTLNNGWLLEGKRVYQSCGP
jgi:hypothetical protein